MKRNELKLDVERMFYARWSLKSTTKAALKYNSFSLVVVNIFFQEERLASISLWYNAI